MASAIRRIDFFKSISDSRLSGHFSISTLWTNGSIEFHSAHSTHSYDLCHFYISFSHQHFSFHLIGYLILSKNGKKGIPPSLSVALPRCDEKRNVNLWSWNWVSHFCFSATYILWSVFLTTIASTIFILIYLSLHLMSPFMTHERIVCWEFFRSSRHVCRFYSFL